MNDAIQVDDQIHLSAIKPEDAASFVEYLNDKDIYDRTLRIPYPYAESDAMTFIGIADELSEKHGHPVLFSIREAGGKAIGNFGFEGLSYGHRAEIGYWIGRPYWGRGIMTKVIETMCRFAVDKWDLHRITANAFDFNDASARVLEKNDFQLEGILRKHLKKGDQFITTKLYAKVRG